METQRSNKHRQYFRITLAQPLCGTMTIALIGDRAIQTGNTDVCIEDIGPGGLRFLSHLKLPTSNNIILEFCSKICGQEYALWGSVVRAVEREKNIWEYGVEFHLDEITQARYVTLFHQLAVKVYKYKQWHDCRFCSKENRVQCLKEKIQD
ncbi:MAG: PilZ domain-containing protein [Thermotaleaceae bacterium]